MPIHEIHFCFFAALLFGLSQSAHALDLGTVLRVEVDPCASNFADENADGIIDATDNVTAIGIPVVGVVKVAFSHNNYEGSSVSISYSVPGPNGTVTLHVQLRNDAGESNVMTTTFELNAAGGCAGC